MISRYSTGTAYKDGDMREEASFSVKDVLLCQRVMGTVYIRKEEVMGEDGDMSEDALL